MNICGCLVHVAARSLDVARADISAMDGVEIHAEGDDGRLVVVVEDTADSFASDRIMALHHVPGVISVTLNYHHFEEAPGAVPPSPLSSRRTDA